jgi:hypothetical protein
VWNVTVRLTEVNGAGCVAETMRSQIGVPDRYSLSITRQDTSVAVTLKSASGDYAMLYAQGGRWWFYDVRAGRILRASIVLDFAGNGTLHSIFTFSEDISGRVSH